MPPLLSFVHITDSHITSDGAPLHGVDSVPNLRRAVRLINDFPTPPDFVLHTGDVSHDRGEPSYEQAQAILAELRVPIYYARGNHDDPALLRGARVLVVEDGPTLTHGGMKIGAGVIAADKHGAAELVDPRPYLAGSLIDTFATYPEIGTVLPAMGYGDQQLRDLQATIDAVDCDVVVIGTPIDLARVIAIDKPHVRVSYDLQEIGSPDLAEIVDAFVADHVG